MIMMHEIVHELVVESLDSLSVGGQLPDCVMVLLSQHVLALYSLSSRRACVQSLWAGSACHDTFYHVAIITRTVSLARCLAGRKSRRLTRQYAVW